MSTNGKSRLVFQADNVHSPSCGEPPGIVKGELGIYYGYFENERGEQWVLEIDRSQGRGVLRGGDVGWDTRREVIDGTIKALILSPAEAAWLTTCWKAAIA
jgi:hypothetical protein